MDIGNIVEKYLKENNYDGLYREDSCACKVSDLMPCGEFTSSCKAGVFVECESDEYDWCIGDKEYKKVINSTGDCHL